ncbi:uncharacterized protein E0L32_003725 [Thyridium curvatum]|uniref:Peroxisomal ATPase PEX1 n=1 Tax=Thyridium curvatum TaxID=1093900 RepID=A0A507BHG2_9PEZI|nr:uncharacterized protein E0L32_003725 [Thyridium curvatum]TPX16431.1 hypothetical protein E0L32_003725 [Thyridium curvatum]
MAPRKAPSASAEISLVHLKNCLVNLPASLVSLLVNVNTPAQNVVVELSFRGAAVSNGASADSGPTKSAQRSVFLGWTGMPSKKKLVPLIHRDGFSGSRGGVKEQEVALVEIDPVLAETLGLHDGQKVTAIVHVDPPLVHTINIEPVTPEAWEIIELHANFLELNMQHQVRAVPNPAYVLPAGAGSNTHPLTLHLSPTSTANVNVVSLEPALPSDAPFAKIAPDAEVIVAPKVRSKPSRGSRESRSVASTSKKSGKSTPSTVRRKSGREERKPALFLRGVSRTYLDDYFDDETGAEDLTVWVDRDQLFSQDFRGVKWVTANILRPTHMPAKADAQKQVNGDGAAPPVEVATRVVAQLRAWDDPPSGQLTALSAPLCAALGCHHMVGGVVKLEPASAPLQRGSVQKLKIFPFQDEHASQPVGFRFGGESKAEREESAKRIKHIYAGKASKGLLQGPLTDGQVLGVHDGMDAPYGWAGGILRFDPPPKAVQGVKSPGHWIAAQDHQVAIEVQAPIPRLSSHADAQSHGLSKAGDILVGIDALLAELESHLSHLSSVLLTGAQGAGKTSVAQDLANRLRRDQLFHTTYFPCRKLVNDESRITNIKETLNKLFMEASWGARLGGKAVVILDDLDRLCPVETELQVGNENGRSRQISEAISSIVRQYCGRDSNVVLLATAQGKESLHNVIVGGHVVREIVALKAPDKEARRKVMEAIAQQNSVPAQDRFNRPPTSDGGSRPTTADGSARSEDGAWMDGASQASRHYSAPETTGFVLQDDLDFLDIAGQTDGYMPGDLNLLVARARNEALMRSVTESPLDDGSGSVELARVDFDNALKGFTPASLRNVTLQSSTTTFSSIGGLQETRRVLLETLEYPTKYAPIFAKCPLRLRSGLLLYGYPGCGKTLLASAVAGECGLNFISVKGPEILNKYIGASEKSVRDLFERAQAAKPCVLFFDEFDSIAPKRGHDSTGVTDRVVNQLLTQMDGAEGLSGVYVLAATSRPDLIDPALLRPGRLDKSLLCDFPGVEDRLDIIKALAKKAKLSDDFLSSEDDLLELARRTEGFSGADLQALVSNAQLEAIHDVLDGPDQASSATASGRRGGGAGARKTASSLAAATRKFVQFRYGGGGGGDDEADGAKPKSVQLAEQAAIAAKLKSIKVARQRSKALKGGGGDEHRGGADGAQAEHKEVVIGWKHFVKALEGTRASISVQERARLERIYREFVVGRSGEMKDGQGSMEIGGRSSLM